MEWQHRVTSRAREPDGAWLRDARGTARPIEREPCRLPFFHVAHQLQHRLQPPARGGPPRRAEAESLDDARNPLSVEILARDDDDAAAAEVERGWKDAAVPEGHHGPAAGGDDRLVMLKPLDAPPQRVTKRVDEWIAEGSDGGDLGPFGPGPTPVFGHWKVIGYRLQVTGKKPCNLCPVPCNLRHLRYGSTFTDAVYWPELSFR